MNETLTYAQAPDMPYAARLDVNMIVQRGHVAVVGDAVTYNTVSHNGIIVRPGALGAGSAPPLYDGHPHRSLTGKVDVLKLAAGSAAVSTDRTLVCVWELEPSVAAFDLLIEAAADDQAGLSIGFDPDDQVRRVYSGGRLVDEHTTGRLNHVAFTRDPSFPDAKITAIVGFHATLLRRPGRGLTLTSGSDLLQERQGVAAAEYAVTGNPGAVASMSPLMQNGLAAVAAEKAGAVRSAR